MMEKKRATRTTRTRQRTQKATKTVFVLMPFDDALVGGVYEELIGWAFKQAGFTVNRADDMESSSQRNILKDVINGIDAADVIVADLTDSNANVFYELGIAHALDKNVVLITQDIESVPFDLRSYKILEYDRRLGQIGAAKNELRAIAKDIANDNARFGSPFSDFRPSRRAKATTTFGKQQDTPSTEAQSQPGLIDHAVSVQEGTERGTAILDVIGKHITEVGNEAADNTEEIKELSKAKNFKALRNLLRMVAKGYTEHANEIHSLTSEFRVVWSKGRVRTGANCG